MGKIFYLRFKITGAFLVLILSVLFLWQCKDPELTTSTTKDVNITEYLEQSPADFSDFTKILEVTGNAGFLGAYGTYTVFAPNNAAFAQFLQSQGKSSINELDIEEMKQIVKFHLMEDTISTTFFTDGKIERPTMHGQYLTTGALNQDGGSFIRVNRQANIIKGNVKLGNGIIHVIDGVLTPAKLTLAQMVEQNPEYSIFTQAMKETGFYDSLNISPKKNPKENRKWLSLIVQTNATFEADGIKSYDELKAQYSNLGNPKDSNDSLYLFVAYRILPELKYLADIVTAPSHPTLAPLEVITSRLDGETIRVNADVFNGIQEPGTTFNRSKSDYSATNGVFHTVDVNFKIKVRKPVPIYWEVTDQPEFRKLSNFRKAGANQTFSPGSLKDIRWEDGGTSTPANMLAYNFGGGNFVNGDHLTIPLRTQHVPWVEFTTPLIVKGKYKVWICYRKQNYNDFQAFFNNEALPRIFGLNPGASYPSGKTDAEAEAMGWKAYNSPLDLGRWVSRLLGVIDVKTTDRHKLKIISLTGRGGSTGNSFWLDMIHFIPANEEQKWPRFDAQGNQIPKPE